ncbi:MAG: hypothetical protein IPG85_08040 [Bacteroidetes bacterium]|nr:hypothetical protein [Bacteroidota bacterium]
MSLVELRIVTENGELVEEPPTVFQNELELKSKWVVVGNTVSYHIDNYNPNLPLIIDPAVRVWGTFYGGIGTDLIRSISAHDTFIYASGETESYNNIATSGSFDTTLSGINRNSFLCKFDSNGVRQWGTYYGSGSSCYNEMCTTDINGDIYLVGRAAFSGNYLTTPGCHQPVFGGGADIYIAKFNSSGYRIWATYYGGTMVDEIRSCTTDIKWQFVFFWIYRINK